MFVRIGYLSHRTATPSMDSYVMESRPGDTFEEVQQRLTEAGFRRTGEFDDPHVWIMPAAIMNIARCDKTGYTEHERKELSRNIRVVA